MAAKMVQKWDCFYLSVILYLLFSIHPVRTELSSVNGRGNLRVTENDVVEGSDFQDRVGSTHSHNILGRQATGNASLNQLADNLNRLEGNLAGLIQSFLALQRSVFNLEQLQELLVLLLEDILKQSGTMDTQGGSAVTSKTDAATSSSSTSSSVSNDASDMDDDDNDNDDDGVNSAEIDEDGDDTPGTDDGDEDGDEDGDDGANETEGNGGDGDSKGISGGGGGGEGGGNVDKGVAEPFGALKDFNTVSTTAFNQETSPDIGATENRAVKVMKHQPSTETPIHAQHSRESEGGSSEMFASSSVETSGVVPRGNSIQPKPIIPSSTRRRESDVKKPPVNEPLVTFAAQLETRLNDLLRRLGTFAHGQTNHHERLALMRHAAGGSSSSVSHASESPMAPRPPPLFEPLEIVAANVAASGKSPIPDVLPVKVKLWGGQMSPIISHGGPLVGPEDFSSPFMEHLGSDEDTDSGESLNERSTGMINNLVHHHDHLGVPAATEVRTPKTATAPQPQTLPSATDRRRRRAKASHTVPTASSIPTNAALLLHEDNSSVQITFVNVSNSSDPLLKATKSTDDTFQTKQGSKPVSPMTTPTPTANTTPSDDFDFLIANLLHDLSQRLKTQYLSNKHDTSTNEDIDRAVLELNQLIWIPSTTNSSVVVNSNIASQDKTENIDSTTVAVSTTKIIEKGNAKLVEKTGSNKSTNKDQTKKQKHISHKVKYALAGSQMDQGGSEDTEGTTSTPDIGSQDKNPSSQNTSEPKETSQAMTKSVPLLKNTSQSTQWDWLKQLPLVERNTANLDWLVGTLSHLSQHTAFSDELNSISARGNQLVKNNRGNVSPEIKEGATSQEKTDSSHASKSEDDASNSEDSSLEDIKDGVSHMPTSTATTVSAIHREQEDSRERGEDYLSNLDDEQIDKDDLQGDNDVATSDEEGSEETDSEVGSVETDDDVDSSRETTDHAEHGKEDDDQNYSTDDLDGDLNSLETLDADLNSLDTPDGDLDSLDTLDSDVAATSLQRQSFDDNKLETSEDNDINADMKHDKSQKHLENKDMTEGMNEDKNEEFISDNDDNANNDDDDGGDGGDNVSDEDDDKDTTVDEDSNETKSSDDDEDGHDKSNIVESSENMDMKDNDDLQDISSENIVKAAVDLNLNDLEKESTAEESEEVNSLKRMSYVYSVGNHQTHPDTIRMLETPALVDDITSYVHSQHTLPPSQSGNHQKLYKRNTRRSVLSSAPFKGTSKVHRTRKHQTHRIRKRQAIPDFWQFLYGNRRVPSVNLPSQTLGAQPSQSFDNLFSLGHPQGQTRSQNLPMDPSLDSPQFGLHPPMDQFSRLGHQQPPPPPHPQTHNKNSLHPNLNHPQHNPFGQPSAFSPSFPFHPPIGGYPQYYGYQGFQYPQFGYPGGDPSNYEPGESPAAEAAADMEELLTNLFNRHWENVRNLFPSKGPTTILDGEYEGPITTRATTTTTTPAQTTTATPKRILTTITSTTTAPTTTTTATRAPNPTTSKTAAATTRQAPVTTTTTPNVTVTMSSALSVNATQQPLANNTLNLNTTTSAVSNQIEIGPTDLNNSTVPSNSTTSLPLVKPTLFLSLKRSLEKLTRKPVV